VSSAHLTYRPDIEGLRALAVGGVLLFHAGWPFVAGGYVGVDVFFVVSGFLMTALIVSERRATGSFGFRAFYTRRIRRILPAATTVLVATAVLSLWMMPWLDWARTGWDILSAGLFASNFRFALGATDYLAEDFSVSPVLNYWSLSVEEQFYLVWPLVILGLLAIRYRHAVLFGFLTLIGVSLGYSVWLTDVNQPWAFFMMPTRAWEFAIGGVVALLLLRFQLSRRTATALGWAGGGAVVLAMLIFSRSTTFPGSAALLPVLGTAAVIWAGAAGCQRGTFAGLLASRPMRAVGRVSYSWYLWHFPPLILIPIWLDRELDPLFASLIVVVSWLPAYLTYRWVENPIRKAQGKMRSGRAAVAILVASIVAASVAAAALIWWPRPAADVLTSSAPKTVESSEPANPEPANSLTPTVEEARDDIPDIYADGCHLAVPDVQLERCGYGQKRADYRVFLVGDSHAAQWQPALARLADEQGWELRSLTKSSCAPGTGAAYLDEPFSRPYRECKQWLTRVKQEIKADQPDLVVSTGWQPEEMFLDGARESGALARNRYERDLVKDLSDMAAGATELVWLGDTPWPGVDVPVCLAKKGNVDDCSVALGDALPDTTAVDSARELGIPTIDMNGSICGPVNCEAVRFNRIVWRDKHHLTASYSEALAPVLLESLQSKRLSNG
jgi:peptidoglycan/LPS O-acetylase OafA/YrhL